MFIYFFFRFLPISYLIRVWFPLVVYHKQTTVASVMYKYLIHLPFSTAVPVKVHRWPSPAGFTSASWDPACHIRRQRGTLDRQVVSAVPLHQRPADDWARGWGIKKRKDLLFVLLIFWNVGLFHVRYNKLEPAMWFRFVLMDCKFKIAPNCFPIIFLRLPSPKKVGCITMHMELAQERFIGYFCSLNHSSARNKFGLNTGFARFVRFYFTCTSCFGQRF